MSTRSLIGLLENNTYKCVYCHFDGYIEGVGFILDKFYNDIKSINELLSHGNMSSLGETIEKTKFYNENYENYILNNFKVGDIEEDIDFLYLFDTNKNRWYVVDLYKSKRMLILKNQL